MESFSWVSEGPSPLKETQTVKKIFLKMIKSHNMCTEDWNSTSTKEEAPPIYFQEDLRWGNTTEAGVWMRNMERGPNFKAAELTKNILSTASHFPSSTTETIRLLYTYVIFQNTHA